MSKKARLLTENDVPQYIKEIVKRLYPILIEYKDGEGDWWGYTFKLEAKWKCGYESQLQNDCQKLIKWCESWNTYSKVIKYKWWYNEVPLNNEYQCKGTEQHRRKALNSGWRNHVQLVISDPVAHRFEKDNYYRVYK